MQRTGRTRPTGDSPGSGLCATLPAPSTSKNPGLCATPRGGHPSPFFGSRGRQDLRVSPAASVGRWATSHRDVAAPHPWQTVGLRSHLPVRSAQFATGKLRPTTRFSPAGSVGRWATSHRDVAAPKPHKFFEKNLTKNFYLSRLNPSAGFWASVSQPAPPP